MEVVGELDEDWLRGLDLNQRSRPRDYEPDERTRPVAFKKPAPPFWRFKKFSNRRAVPRATGWLVHTNDHGPRARVQREMPELCCANRTETSALRPM